MYSSHMQTLAIFHWSVYTGTGPSGNNFTKPPVSLMRFLRTIQIPGVDIAVSPAWNLKV